MNKCSMSSMSKVLHGGYGSLLAVLLFISTSPVASQSCLTSVVAKPSGPTQKYVLTFSHAPIAGMAVCDRLIVSSGAMGPFSGHEDEYAYYVGGDPSLLSSWAFADPFDGDLAYVVAPDAKYYRFRNTGVVEWTALAFE